MEDLNDRQKYVKRFYDSAKVPVFKSNDYSLIAPDPKRSLFVSDECVCIGKVLFGSKFDIQIRKFAAHFWFPALLYQIFGLVIGLLVISESIPSWTAFLCIPGGVFPILLLLRSHAQIAKHLFMQWEPMFLVAYSFAFCISTTWHYNSSGVFICSVVFPTLVSSAFADASALRLDYAFIKGDINAAFLALPPYVVATTAVVIILLLSKALTGRSDGSELQATTVMETTGFTITLFLIRSIVLLIIEPRRCVALHAPMMNCIASLSPDTSRATEAAVAPGFRNMFVSFTLLGKIEVVSNDMSSDSPIREAPASPPPRSSRLTTTVTHEVNATY